MNELDKATLAFMLAITIFSVAFLGGIYFILRCLVYFNIIGG